MENRLRDLRAERNWSQADLAKRLDVSRQTVNALEVGKSEPSLSLAAKIAQLFGCSIEAIFFSKERSMFAKFFDGLEDNIFGRFIQKILPIRFTEKAIKVITLAQQESRRLKHSYVGTEQILLGLMSEGTGVAAKILTAQGVTLKDAQREVEQIIGRGSGLVRIEISFTPRGKRVLELSLEAARQFNHNYIDTEHLLLGLIREGEGLGARILKISFGVNLQNLEQQILEHLSGTIVEDGPSLVQMPIGRFSRNHNSATDQRDYSVDFTTGEISARLCALLLAWVEPRKLGRVVSSRSGFQLPNGNLLIPQIAFVSQERLKWVPRTYPDLAPDLVMEIKSAFDQLAPLQEKVQFFIEQGVRVGLLINPDEQTITIHHATPEGPLERTVLRNGDTLTLPDLLPGWEVPVSQLWSPEMD